MLSLLLLSRLAFRVPLDLALLLIALISFSLYLSLFNDSVISCFTVATVHFQSRSASPPLSLDFCWVRVWVSQRAIPDFFFAKLLFTMGLNYLDLPHRGLDVTVQASTESRSRQQQQRHLLFVRMVVPSFFFSPPNLQWVSISSSSVRSLVNLFSSVFNQLGMCGGIQWQSLDHDNKLIHEEFFTLRYLVDSCYATCRSSSLLSFDGTLDEKRLYSGASLSSQRGTFLSC